MILLVAWLMVSGHRGARAADEVSGQVWLISTRHAPTRGAVDAAEATFHYWRMGPDGNWHAADLPTLLAEDNPAIPTTFYVHGNRTDRHGAVDQSWPVYRCLEQQSAGRPFRFVIWSWPANRVRGRIRHDLRIKAARSDSQAYYLAWHLNRLRPDVPFNLVGYSFGARVITGSLHILGGGQVAGHALPEHTASRAAPIRVVLVAAAIDNDWLLPGRRHGLALGQVQQLLVTRNDRDRVLRLYPRMRGSHRGPDALGSAGPVSLASLGTARRKVKLVGLSGFVGKVHDWRSYFSAPRLRAQLPTYAFLDSSEEEIADSRRSPAVAGITAP